MRPGLTGVECELPEFAYFLIKAHPGCFITFILLRSATITLLYNCVYCTQDIQCCVISSRWVSSCNHLLTLLSFKINKHTKLSLACLLKIS